MTNHLGQDDSFRDHIATVDRTGKRVWLYPMKPGGRLYRMRSLVSILQFAILIGLPFLKINGHPAVLLQIVERKLFFFGYIFRPQDAFLLALMLICFVLFILFFTSIFGRIWCGWLCPQTIFLEMLFRKIEYVLEGNSAQQKRLNQEPLNLNKFIRKSFKHGLFLFLSFFISNIFLSYIIGVDELLIIIADPISMHSKGFAAIIGFSLVFYGVFAWFREQACLVVCPYGRLQSALQDQHTMMVSYDYLRGEPRGKATKANENKSIGDCVDCKMCVRVCPSGIDIRNGIQMECINCTSCIDSCNDIMEKLGRPKGLIRYSSAKMIETKTKFKFTIRMFSYMLAFAVLLGVNLFFLSQHSFLGLVVSRIPGMLYQKIDDNHIANVYDMQMINNTFDEKKFSLKVLEPMGEVQANMQEFDLKGDSSIDFKFLVVLPIGEIKNKSTPVTLGVFHQDKLIKKIKAPFLGPTVERAVP